MKRLAVGLLGVLLVGAATLFLAADQIVERVITAWLSDKLDRRIEVMGEFSTELGNPLRFRAKSIRLANPDWLDEPIMATASFVEAAIDLTTLPGEEPLVIEKLEIRDLNAGLVSNEKGQANWVFGNPDSTGETNFRIRDLDVIDGSLAIARAGLDRVNVSIKKLAQNADANELLRTEVVGTVNDRPVDVKGLLGPFPSLLSGKDLRVAINGTVGELQIKGYGQIDDVTAPRQPILKVEVFAPSAMEVASTFGLNFEGESTSVIDLVLDIAPLGQGVSVVGGGDWGEDRIDFKGTIDDLLELDGVQFEASGRGDDLQGSLILFGFRELPDVGYSFNGNISRNGGRADVDGLEFVVGGFEFKLDGELNSFPSLNDANLKFSVRGDDVARFRETFGLPGVAKGEFTLQGELERSPAGLDEFRLRSRTEIGRAKLFGTLGTGEEYAGTRASFRGEGKNLRRFAELLGLPGLKDQPFSLDLEVEALVEGWVVLDGTSLKAGDSVLTTTGTLGDRPLVSGTDLKWSLKGVDIADVARVAGLPVSFPSRQIDMSGQVIPRPADFLLRGVEGTIGLGEFSIDGQVGRKDQFRGTDLRVSARGPKLENLEFLVGDANLPEGPFQLSGRVQRTARGLRISDSIIDVADAEGKADLDIAIPSDTLDVNFDIEIEGPDIRAIWESRYGVKFAEQDFVIDARGEVNDDKWQLEDGQIRIGKTEVDIRGDVQRNRGKLSVQANSPDIAGLGTIFGITVLPGRSLKLSGELERTGELVRLDNFLARTNKGDLAGEITFAPGSQRPRITANVTSQALDITWLTDPVTNEILYNRPEREAEERGDGRVIPDWTLPLDTLKLYDLDLSIAADEIIREDRDIRNAFIRIVAQDGALSVAPWRFEGGSGTLDAEFRLTPVDANVADAEVRVEAQNLITEFFVSGQQDVSVLPKGNWDVNLKSRGSNLRELFAELDGVAKLSSSAGRVANNVARSAIFGDLIGNITGAVNPDRDTDKFTDINCAVFPFTFDKGRMETTPSIVVQTSKLNIISQGFVDLKTESLDLSFNSKPSGGVGLSAGSVVNPFIRIGGTMADPNVTLNPAGAALTTGAAVLTLGLSVIAKAAFDAAWRSPDPCGRVLEQAEKRFAKENRRRED